MQRVKGTSDTEKIIGLFMRLDDGRYQIYDTSGYHTILYEHFKLIKSRPLSSTHILVEKDKKSKNVKNLNMTSQYKLIIEEAEYLKELTNGRLNLYKTGSVAKTALTFFYSYQPPIASQIKEYEVDFIELCYNGGMVFGQPYKGKAYKYDVCSEYPSIMRSDHMKFPIGEGELITITNLEIADWKFFKYGIYRAKVIGANNKLLKTNDNDGYTHIDLNRAKELKYKIEVIEDNYPNFLSYEGKLMNGAKLFREPIDYLFSLKQNGHKPVKIYLNAIWGALCQKDIMRMNSNSSTTFIDGHVIESITPTDSGNLIIKTIKKTHAYETNYARIKAFLLAKGRYIVTKIIEKNIDNVIRCHTDGIILSKPIKDVKLGSNIGDLKYEGYCETCLISNAISVEGTFII